MKPPHDITVSEARPAYREDRFPRESAYAPPADLVETHRVEVLCAGQVVGVALFSILAPDPHPTSPFRMAIAQVTLFGYPASLRIILDATTLAGALERLTPILRALGTLEPRDLPGRVEP